MKAIAVLAGESLVRGWVTFEQVDRFSPLNVSYEIWGQAPNTLRGMHVHQFGDMSMGCTSHGPHLNPFNMNHGGPADQVRHLGDLGNIATDENGLAKGWILDNYMSLYGDHSIMGRGIVVHNATDDFGKGGNEESLKTGNSGYRNACGIIGYSSTP